MWRGSKLEGVGGTFKLFELPVSISSGATAVYTNIFLEL